MEEAARVRVRRRIIERSVGWKRLPTKPGPEGPSAYLLYCTGAGGGGGGLEAQETTTIEAARARSAYFIVWCSLCLLLFSRPVQGRMEYLRNNNEPVFCKQANQPAAGK